MVKKRDCPAKSGTVGRSGVSIIKMHCARITGRFGYCITPIFRVEEIFAIFAKLDVARNFPPAKIISTANGISRNFPPAKYSSSEMFLPTKIQF